jgi:hypothetical protein
MTLMLEYVHSSQQKKNLSWTEGCDMQRYVIFHTTKQIHDIDLTDHSHSIGTSKTDPGVTNRSLDKPSLLEQQDQL